MSSIRNTLVIFMITTFLTFAAATFSAANAADSTRPNILLVMADDQGWGDMAYNGHTAVKTPNFDEAAATGLRFDQFYAAAPVCSPTRASVMTGRHPNRMGVFKWGYPMRPQETTIAEALKSAGYVTAHFGKWHLGSVRNQSPASPGKNGFDEWLSAPNFYDNDATLSHRGTAVKTKGESSMIVADAAIEWIDKTLEGDQPFLAVVWFGSPHGPHIAAERDKDLYADQPAKSRNFLGEVTGMDRAFGKLRSSLKDLDIHSNTLLWYCSDNGALKGVGSAGPYRGNKGQIYEGGLMVPSILEWPARISKHRTIKARCNTSDIYPTLLEIAGAEVPKQQPMLDGISLLSVIDGKSDRRSSPMGFWDYDIRGIGTPSEAWMTELFVAQQSGGDLPPHPSSRDAGVLPSTSIDSLGHAAWIDGDRKLHRIQKGDNVTFELYDLSKDPYEKKDLFPDMSQTADVQAMQSALAKWLASVKQSYAGADYAK